MLRLGYLSLGFLALGLGAIGIFLPLLPTVPFIILAAFFFARSSPRLEAKLLDHAQMGPHIRAWREKGAVSRKGKRAALIAFGVSAAIGLVTLSFPWLLLPLTAASVGGLWIATRPEP